MHADSETTTPQKPMELSGALDQFESFQNTPCIGTEFRNVDLAEWITGPSADARLRDLAILVCQRGVVFFRGQTKVDGTLQKQLTQRMGILSGKPQNHGLGKHPLHLIRGDDPEMGKLDAATQQALHSLDTSSMRQTHANEWHSDGSYETCPPDFTILRMTNIPPTGGDTLWASGYELYDRLSTPYQKFFESLTATHDVPGLRSAAQTMKVYEGERGAPENTSLTFRNSQPMVRTHPVTRWKTLFAGGLHCRRIDDVSEVESQEILAKILRLVADNHDLQVRFKWENSGDMALWDNRCVLHCATQDHQGLGFRMGWRTISIAEKPFLDPRSMSRRQTWQAKLKGAATTNGTDKKNKLPNGTNTKDSHAVNGTIID